MKTDGGSAPKCNEFLILFLNVNVWYIKIKLQIFRTKYQNLIKNISLQRQKSKL